MGAASTRLKITGTVIANARAGIRFMVSLQQRDKSVRRDCRGDSPFFKDYFLVKTFRKAAKPSNAMSVNGPCVPPPVSGLVMAGLEALVERVNFTLLTFAWPEEVALFL